jgi:hypothetical protein
MTGLDDPVVSTELGLFILVAVFAVWRRLGGWPEAWYRITHKPYFVAHIFGASGASERYVLPWDAIEHHSPAQFDLHGKKWTIDEDNTMRDTGRPAWYFVHGDTRALPIRHWQDESKISPQVLYQAWKNKALQEMHGLGQKQPNWFLYAVLIVIVMIILVSVSAYYSYNAYCAVSKSCGGGVNFHG